MYNTTSMKQIIETLLEADTLPRMPRKIKMSYNAYHLLNSMIEKEWVPGIEDMRWDGIPIETDADLFGYTYELVYEENNND